MKGLYMLDFFGKQITEEQIEVVNSDYYHNVSALADTITVSESMIDSAIRYLNERLPATSVADDQLIARALWVKICDHVQ